MRHTNNEKVETTRQTEWNNQIKKKIRTLGEKETYKYLVILEANTIKYMEMQEKNLKEYPRRKRKQLEMKLYNRNHIKRINTWAVLLVRCSGPILNLKGT